MPQERPAAPASEKSVSRGQYAALIELLPEAVVVHREDRILFANRAAATLFAASAPRELVGRRVLDLVHPDYRTSVEERVRRIAQGEGIAEPADEKLLRLDGEPIDAEVTARAIDYDGKPAIQAIVRNITQRKLAEQALRESEERFRHLTETIPEIFWMVEPHKRNPWYVSPAGERIYGISAAEFRRNPQITLERIHPEDQPRVLPIMLESPVVPYDLEYRIVRPDGQIRWVRSRSFPTVGENGEIVRITGFTEDITRRKDAEIANLALHRALKDSEERYRELVEASPDGVFVHAHDRILYVNSAGARLVGATDAKSLVGRNRMDFIHPDDHAIVMERIAEAQRSKRPTALLHERFLRLDGGQVDVEVLSMPIVYAGQPAVLGLVRDVTAKLQAERELIAAKDAALESSRLKSAFLANMSHEIRTPLNVMLGLSSFIAEHLSGIGDHSQDAHFQGITRASRRLLATIQGILDLSKIETGSFELRRSAVDLRSLVDQQLVDFAPLAEKKGIALSCQVEADEAVVRFDEYCLSQALTNLLDNAIKFTARGSVCVRLQRHPEGALVLELEDTGIGIDEVFLPRLCEPFSQQDVGYTRRFEGSGLGLALVKKYLEMNGARLEVESRKGEGSLFRIRFSSAEPRLPDTQAEPVQAGVAATTSSPASSEEGRPTILLVEDDPDTQAYMKCLLRSRWTVLCASSGEECRARLESHGRDIRLVLMDLSLRGPEDGLGLTRYVRERAEWRTLPIIAVTAHAFEKDRENAARAGCDDFVAKPIDRRALLAKMTQLLRRSERGVETKAN